MAITSDGTQRFGIKDSPLNINNVTYIAEDLTLDNPGTTVEIKDQDGSPTGQTIITENPRLSGTLQLATNSTVLPPIGTVFEVDSANYILESTGRGESQGGYAKVPFTAVAKIN